MNGNVIHRTRALPRIAALVFSAIVAAGVATPTVAHAQFGISISVGTAPPPLPYYEQPYVPGPDFIWMPGYWAWGPAGYYWVPGSWVLAPEPGLLWTPGYWGWNNTVYVWHPGYWARHVGFYGGVNYGYGYYGNGYVGGRWYRNHFRYNTVVTRVNTVIVRNVYVDNRVVVHNWRTTNRVSYNGGQGGLVARPTQRELGYHDPHIAMTSVQRQHERVASQDRNQLASVNNDRPKALSTAQPFSRDHRPVDFEHVRPTDRTARPVNGARAPRHTVRESGSATAPTPSTPRMVPPRAPRMEPRVRPGKLGNPGSPGSPRAVSAPPQARAPHPPPPPPRNTRQDPSPNGQPPHN